MTLPSLVYLTGTMGSDGLNFSVVNTATVLFVFLMQSGLTALHLAAQEDKVAVAEILARNGANLDQQTKV